MATPVASFRKSITKPPLTTPVSTLPSYRTTTLFPPRSARCADCIFRRRPSPRISSYVSRVVELSTENWRQLLIPIGFAHGFVTLEPDTEVLYKTTAVYSPAHDRGLAWDDPDIGVKWPLPAGGAVLSDRDRRWPRLKDAPDLFE